MDESLAGLRELVHRAASIVLFTGAGASTDSGVPDFRTPGGIWDQFTPIPFKDFLASAETRLIAWRRYFDIHASFAGARPGESHQAIAALFARGNVAAVITQNIDGLHHAAGIPASRIVELHGNGTYAACLSCRARHEIDWARRIVEQQHRAPECLSCGGPVKSATIAFGQPMPADAMNAAKQLTRDADLFISIGSSLRVQPAAGFPLVAAERGVPLAIINREATPLDRAAEFVLRGEAGPILSMLGGERAFPAHD